jgi:hypothetical protein
MGSDYDVMRLAFAPAVVYCCHVPQELYKQVAWPLYKSHGHAFEAFKNMVQDDGAAIFSKLQEGGPLAVLTPQVQEALLKNIKRRMTPQPLKIRADVELTCFAYDGVERIRDAMRAAQVCGGGLGSLGHGGTAAQGWVAAWGFRGGAHQGRHARSTGVWRRAWVGGGWGGDASTGARPALRSVKSSLPCPHHFHICVSRALRFLLPRAGGEH